MSLTLKNIGIGAEDSTGRLREPMASCWEEESRWARYDAVSDACWIYQDWDLEQNLRHLGWRQARRRTLSQGALSQEWMNHGRGDLRLTKGGLEMKFASGVQTIDWQNLKDMIEARRS